MPTDKFGFPFFHPTKSGGYFYEESSNPKNDAPVEGLDQDFSVSGNVITMKCNGPTSFSIGKNGRGFSDSIGGCNMDFKATAARGYGYKKDDVRDLEFKCQMKINSIGAHGFSLSACTGHHSSSGCCQGFAYMCTIETSANPASFRFRKEMWHVSYHDSPEGAFGHDVANFKLDGHGWFGYGFCRYNNPDDANSVILEVWLNPNPDGDASDWTMLKRIQDSPGNGWGNDGDKCNGAKDQVGTWSNAHNRLKSNATSGTINFKNISFREIDPTGDFGEPPPPDPGGGGGGPLVKKLYYAVVCAGSATGTAAYSALTGTISHEIVEAQTSADPFGRFGKMAWKNYTPSIHLEVADECTDQTFADGLVANGYWSNSDANCVVPHVSETDLGNSTKFTTKGGKVLKTPGIYLIYWGTTWRDSASAPTNAVLTDKIQNKLLGTDNAYFSKLSQYSSIGIPTWKGAVFNVTTPVPTGTSVTESKTKECIAEVFNRGLIPLSETDNENIYIVVIPIGVTLSDPLSGSSFLGSHDVYNASLNPVPDPTPDPGGGGTGGGEPPTTTETIHGTYRIMRDIDIYRTNACAGTGGGGGSGGSAKFYVMDPESGHERSISNSATHTNRTRISELILDSSSSIRGKIITQADVYLRKIGTPGATPVINFVIWNGRGAAEYTSPTDIAPSALTSSFVTYSFDCSTNTHVCQTGDYVGVVCGLTSATDYIAVPYSTVEGTGTQHSEQAQYESAAWSLLPARRMSMNLWEGA